MLDPFGRVRRMRGPSTAPRDPAHPGWPEATASVRLIDGSALRLRPLTVRDGEAWSQQRIIDESWLRPVEPTQHASWAASHDEASWRHTFGHLRDMSRRGIIVPLVIEVDGQFAGQVTIGNIQHGGVSEAWVGYWVHSPYMGRGAAVAACALATDHAFSRIGLHRLTATYLPDNPASGRVLAVNGYREEGFLRQNLHIDGRWRDHHFVAQLADEHPDTCVSRLLKAGRLAAWR